MIINDEFSYLIVALFIIEDGGAGHVTHNTLTRGTQNYFVYNLLSGFLPSVRERLFSKYVGVFQKLLTSACLELGNICQLLRKS